MKKVFIIILSLLLALPISASDVRYSGTSGEFIFAPGSEHSPTDLFTEFKNVMPGDSLTQEITVRNDASKDVKVKIYVRSLGAQEGSEEFLSQLNLRVAKSADNDMAYMFDASADQTAQLTDWVYLGTLYSGGEVNLDVILDVPVEMGNEYSDRIGYLDWEFKVEEYPVEEGDPQAPQTWDMTWIFAGVMICAGFVLILLIRRRRAER